jgi:hypothetical protein
MILHRVTTETQVTPVFIRAELVGVYFPAAGARAITAQLVAAAEIHWSGPNGKPLSK